LRGCSERDADANTNANCNSYSDCDADCYTHGYGDGNAHANCDALHGQMYTYSQASSDAATSTLDLTVKRHFETEKVKFSAYILRGSTAHAADLKTPDRKI
jgi:hypothetical protein